MTEKKLLRAIATIENCTSPWGEELGKLVSLDRLLFERCTIHPRENALPILELSAIEATLYLNNVYSLSWAIVLFLKPKNFCFATPRNHREDYKPLGAVLAAVMELTEKLHSLDKSRTYRHAAEWFRLIVEEQDVQGLSTGLGKTEDIKLLQEQNSRLSDCECPFTKRHTSRLIELAIEYQHFGRIVKSYRQFVARRKTLATALKSSKHKALIDHGSTIAIAPNGRQVPKQIVPLFIDGVKTL